jgi:exopolysaccharide biosynthesis protein
MKNLIPVLGIIFLGIIVSKFLRLPKRNSSIKPAMDNSSTEKLEFLFSADKGIELWFENPGAIQRGYAVYALENCEQLTEGGEKTGRKFIEGQQVGFSTGLTSALPDGNLLVGICEYKIPEIDEWNPEDIYYFQVEKVIPRAI